MVEAEIEELAKNDSVLRLHRPNRFMLKKSFLPGLSGWAEFRNFGMAGNLK